MSTQEILPHIGSLSLSDRMTLLEAILQTVKAEIEDPEAQKRAEQHKEEIRRRRREFVIPTFDLGCDVIVDRDEIYADRGL
ncbi:hypothetical protein L0337_13140 [candidate division KSB1 bacterium]|nr:hypothetical protein [candidate division KSB1 bacterium]